MCYTNNNNNTYFALTITSLAFHISTVIISHLQQPLSEEWKYLKAYKSLNVYMFIASYILSVKVLKYLSFYLWNTVTVVVFITS